MKTNERAAFEAMQGAWQHMTPFQVFAAGWKASAAAPPAASIPDGWQLVPKELTDEMVDAKRRLGDVDVWEMWKALLEAAPQAAERGE